MDLQKDFHKIFIHCSASHYGDTDLIRKWHLKRGFDDVGYHYVILNPFSNIRDWAFDKFRIKIRSHTDGTLESGRSLDYMGAHVKGENKGSIGICYIGYTPTVSQYITLTQLCIFLQEKYSIETKNIFGHYEHYTKNGYPELKTCPNFDMSSFRRNLSYISS